MQYDAFINRVQERAQLTSREDAEALTTITLSTLAEPLSREVVNLLASQLPKELKELLASHREVPLPAERTMQSYTLEEFYNRVKARLNVRFQEGANMAQAVTMVLPEALPPDVIERVRQDLPAEYAELFRASR